MFTARHQPCPLAVFHAILAVVHNHFIEDIVVADLIVQFGLPQSTAVRILNTNWNLELAAQPEQDKHVA